MHSSYVPIVSCPCASTQVVGGVGDHVLWESLRPQALPPRINVFAVVASKLLTRIRGMPKKEKPLFVSYTNGSSKMVNLSFRVDQQSADLLPAESRAEALIEQTHQAVREVLTKIELKNPAALEQFHMSGLDYNTKADPDDPNFTRIELAHEIYGQLADLLLGAREDSVEQVSFPIGGQLKVPLWSALKLIKVVGDQDVSRMGKVSTFDRKDGSSLLSLNAQDTDRLSLIPADKKVQMKLLDCFVKNSAVELSGREYLEYRAGHRAVTAFEVRDIAVCSEDLFE